MSPIVIRSDQQQQDSHWLLGDPTDYVYLHETIRKLDQLVVLTKHILSSAYGLPADHNNKLGMAQYNYERRLTTSMPLVRLKKTSYKKVRNRE